MATRRYLPSTDIVNYHDQIELHCTSTHCPVHDIENDNRNYLSFESDEFRMYSFKVLMCHKTYSHDWTSCPYTHRGERARRRPPCRYLPIQCPYFKGDDTCRRGNSCKLAHGTFEYWLHPGKYRTSMCTNGTRCDRKVCFFAHTPEELREEIPIQGDERYLAFTSDVQMPVVVPPRHAGRVVSNTNYAPGSPYITAPASGSSGNSAAALPSTSRYIVANGDNTRNFNNFGTPSSSTFGSSLPDLSSLPYNFDGLSLLLKEIEEQGKVASAPDNDSRQQELDWNFVEPFEWDNDSFWK